MIVKPKKLQPEAPKSHNKQKEITSHSTQQSARKTQNTCDSDLENADDNELIDLTKSYTPKKPINQFTLLVGSSILKNVKVNDLNKNTAVRSFSGATIHKLGNRLNQYDTNKC